MPWTQCLGDVKQQKFRSFRPLYLPRSSAILCFVIGAVILSTGITVLQLTRSNIEISVQYSGDTCVSTTNGTEICDRVVLASPGSECRCTVNFTVRNPLRGRILFFYGLDEFYMNNRWYFHSRDDAQLAGNAFAIDNPSSSCKPFVYAEKKIPIVPCGSMANSIFNDSFRLFYFSKDGQIEVTMEKDMGLISQYGLQKKYKNPSNMSLLAQSARPPYWSPELSQKFLELGFEYHPLIVWMQPAALPKFRKRYATFHPNSTVDFKDGLPRGEYQLEVQYRYAVSAFSGKKRFILDTVSWMGPKRHLFLPISYIVLGSIFLILSAIFLILHYFGPMTRVRSASTSSYGSTNHSSL